MCVCMCVFMYICGCICMYVCVYIYICTCDYMCIVYIYIYIYIYIYTIYFESKIPSLFNLAYFVRIRKEICKDTLIISRAMSRTARETKD